MFGRKGLAPSPAISQEFGAIGEAQGHIATIEHAKAAGEFFFELVYQQMAQTGDAVGIENFLALLATAGGVSCIAAALCEYEVLRMRPHDPQLLFEQQVDGHSYFAGDLPGRYLYETSNALLNIALPWAMKHGAAIQSDFLHEPLRHAMNSVGTSAFGIPRLPAANMPNASLLDLALTAWPQAEHTFDQIGLAMDWRPTALGFAIGKAIDIGSSSLDPMILATIAVECAVPMAFVDPSRFMDRLATIRANA